MNSPRWLWCLPGLAKGMFLLPVILHAQGCASAAQGGSVSPGYYLKSGPLDSLLLHLRSDGTFSLYSRTHFTVDERTKGAWKWDSSGVMELSGGWRRHVVRGPFDIGGFGGASGPALSDIRRELSEFLKSRPGSSFPAEEIQRLGTREGAAEVNGEIQRWTMVPITLRAEQVSRAEIETVIEAIDAYPREGRDDVVHARPVPCGSKTFLHWRDGGPGWVEDSLEEIQDAIQADRTLASYGAVFLQVTRKEFEEALGEGQPFLLHPEMNRER